MTIPIVIRGANVMLMAQLKEKKQLECKKRRKGKCKIEYWTLKRHLVFKQTTQYTTTQFFLLFIILLRNIQISFHEVVQGSHRYVFPSSVIPSMSWWCGVAGKPLDRVAANWLFSSSLKMESEILCRKLKVSSQCGLERHSSLGTCTRANIQSCTGIVTHTNTDKYWIFLFFSIHLFWYWGYALSFFGVGGACVYVCVCVCLWNIIVQTCKKLQHREM